METKLVHETQTEQEAMALQEMLEREAKRHRLVEKLHPALDDVVGVAQGSRGWQKLAQDLLALEERQLA